MCRILTLTPFGFVLALGEEGYFYTSKPYTLSINGAPYPTSGELVVSVFGLLPDTEYLAEIHWADITEKITIHTQPCRYVISIKEYNAAGDGVQNDTAAINAAIYSAPPHSVIYFPRGEYLVEHIFFKKSCGFLFGGRRNSSTKP